MRDHMLASDLDNTLIYSYKQEIGPDKVLVETMAGKELSYMTRRSWEWLREIREKACFVPVSTRSVEQYRRICFFKGWTPPLALASNGGTLLVDGREDPAWKAETLRRTEEASEELAAAGKTLEADPGRSFEVRLVDGLFLFTKSERPEESLLRLAEEGFSQLNLFQNGSKIYAVPKSLDKGTAVRRLQEREGVSELWAAGDSEFDIPLLEAADLAFYPSSLQGQVNKRQEKCVVAAEQELLAEVLLSHVRKRLWQE